MKLCGRIVCLTVVIVIFLTSCMMSSSNSANTANTANSPQHTAAQKEWNYDFHYGSDYWNYYDLSQSFIPTQEDYEALVASYIPQIESLLGVQDWYTAYDADADTVFVNLEMGSTPHSMAGSPSKGSNGTIEISILLSFNRVLAQMDTSLPHELTHSILGVSSFSNSLEEGICDYVNARIGVNYNRFFEEYDIDPMDFVTYDAKLALEQFYDEKKSDEMLASIGRAEGYTYSIQTRDGHIWYECSQSFVEYLVKHYGIEKTMQLIREGKDEADYQTYLGIGFEELKTEWITFLKNYESTYTVEEYKQMVKEFFQ